MVFGLTRKKPPRRSRDRPQPINNGICHFKVRTRIAKATGEDKRYKFGAVRVLPTRQRDKVLLQATDGSQAVCVISAGQVCGPRLVPPKILPTKQSVAGVIVELAGSQWLSSDGKTEPDKYAGDSSYPSLAEVLPELKGKPLAVKPDPASKETVHLLLGFDITLLSRIAQSLGTPKLSLLVPVPVRTAGDQTGVCCVNKPVLVCPATDEDKVRGIGVLVPLKPVNGVDYYMNVRQVVAEAEKRLKPRRTRAAKPNRQMQPV